MHLAFCWSYFHLPKSIVAKLLGKKPQGINHTGMLTKTASCLSLGKAGGSTGGPEPSHLQNRRKRRFGVCVCFFCSSCCFFGVFFFICVSHVFLIFIICFQAVLGTILLDKCPIFRDSKNANTILDLVPRTRSSDL